MRTRVIARVAAAVFAAWFAFSAESVLAQGAPPALSGTVASDREGLMEGVLVSARRAGSIMLTASCRMPSRRKLHKRN